jgi:hypothetical protein
MARFVSRSTNLGANEDWTSGEIQPEGGDNLVGIVLSSHAGTFTIEQSADGGTNWDLSTAVAITPGVGVGFSSIIYGNRVRLHVINGATQTTTFRISARMSSTGPRG